MKTVKIVSGTYGYRKAGSRSVKPVHLGETVDLPDEEALRLVKHNVAVYVTEVEPELGSEEETPVAPPIDPPPPASPPGAGEGIEESELLDVPDYHADMSLAELKEIMKDCGLTYTVGTSKVQIVALLDEYFDDADDGEAPPQLSAEGSME